VIPFFVGYALLVWYFAAKHRRQWLGLGWVVLGIAGLMGLNYLHYRIGRWSAARDSAGQGIVLPVLQSIMYPYTGLVGLVGLFIVAMPTTYHTGCFRCGYDLTGLEADRCPECGEPKHRVYRRSGTVRPSLSGSDLPDAPTTRVDPGSPEHEAEDHAQPEHQRGKPEQQRPLERPEL
jgi:ribosomal protein L37E